MRKQVRYSDDGALKSSEHEKILRAIDLALHDRKGHWEFRVEKTGSDYLFIVKQPEVHPSFFSVSQFANSEEIAAHFSYLPVDGMPIHV